MGLIKIHNASVEENKDFGSDNVSNMRQMNRLND